MFAISLCVGKNMVKGIIIIVPVFLIGTARLSTIKLAGIIVLIGDEIVSKIHPVIQSLDKRNVEVRINIGKIVLMPVIVIHVIGIKWIGHYRIGWERNNLAG